MSKKYKLKTVDVDAEQFDSSQPEVDFPSGVVINPSSTTGYSYGSLDIITVSGVENRDGFEIEDTDFLVLENSKVFRMKESDFLSKYEEK